MYSIFWASVIVCAAALAVLALGLAGEPLRRWLDR